MSLISECAALLCILGFQIVMVYCAIWFHFLEEFRKEMAVFIDTLSRVPYWKIVGFWDVVGFRSDILNGWNLVSLMKNLLHALCVVSGL